VVLPATLCSSLQLKYCLQDNIRCAWGGLAAGFARVSAPMRCVVVRSINCMGCLLTWVPYCPCACSC
jgi:hypothetical protein